MYIIHCNHLYTIQLKNIINIHSWKNLRHITDNGKYFDYDLDKDEKGLTNLMFITTTKPHV